MAKTTPTLASRFDLEQHDVILTGMQAIIRLLLTQKLRDEEAGLDTAGFISGYRGSPLGNLDTHLQRARDLLEPRNIRFNPGINEELAATSIWGTQQAEMRGEGVHDGVFAMWYGKGPGVDRCGDVFRHANSAGTSKHGGVLVLMGDDHAAESSTVPHQSEFALIDAMMPILNPAGLQDVLDFGILGYGLSRYSGCWVGLKCLHETIESTATVDADPHRVNIVIPDDFTMPEGGLNIRASDDRFTLERRLHEHKRAAAQAFARANHIDRILWDGGKAPALGIVSTGKSWLDVRQALEELGIDEHRAADLGIRLLKTGMVWPLEPHIIETFAEGLKTIIVVEEKRAIIETQIRDILYNRPQRPIIVGKRDERGETLFPAHGVLEPIRIARAIAERAQELQPAADEKLAAALAALQEREESGVNLPAVPERVPWFCAGCPHNTSTLVPSGARAYAGIGCHWLVQLMEDRNTKGFTQMGCEGANWIGEAPFSRRRHVFQNIGDGTYVHSGLMAIRACQAAGVNITFKILYNDAVAMTGGQPMDGGLSVPRIAHQVRAEGIERIAVVSDEPGKWRPRDFPSGTTFHHRRDIIPLQEELRDVPGVSILIYDQTCAAEKRRRRKRGQYPDLHRYVVINEAVCEGCGDCSAKSNCVAIVPAESPWGRKRRIDQSVCNRDYTCLEGFCPAMVTVEGAPLRPGGTPVEPPSEMPGPRLPELEKPFSMVIAGIGGTGVVTIGQILAQAAKIDGLGAGLIDMSGISQKNGTVFSHLKIAASREDITAIRAAAGGADLILGCDMLTTASDRILYAASPGKTRAVVNSHEVMPARFTHDPDMVYPAQALRLRIGAACGEGNAHFHEVTAMATALLGDAIFANILLMGSAWQKGLIPVSHTAIEEAIRLNGVAVEKNLTAFHWGRILTLDPGTIHQIAGVQPQEKGNESLPDILQRATELLSAYQDADYARQYSDFIGKVRKQEWQKTGSEELTMTVARQLARLMAYKDEYEVARLHADPAFARQIAREFAPGARIRPHFAPPLLSRRKRPWPIWTFRLLPKLARMKKLRGSVFDIFGNIEEHRAGRAAVSAYRELIETLLEQLDETTHAQAVEIAALVASVRGFGPLRQKAQREYEEALRKMLADSPFAGT